MAENWHSLVYFLVEKFCFINRQIDATVAAGILVDGSAEFTSPACVMETDAAVEWHPIVYVTFIFIGTVCLFGAAQNAVGLLVGQAVNTFRGCIVFWIRFRLRTEHPKSGHRFHTYIHAGRRNQLLRRYCPSLRLNGWLPAGRTGLHVPD